MKKGEPIGLFRRANMGCCNQMADIKTVIQAGALLLISCERNQYILKVSVKH